MWPTNWKENLNIEESLSLHTRMCKAAEMNIWMYAGVNISDRSPKNWMQRALQGLRAEIPLLSGGKKRLKGE